MITKQDVEPLVGKKVEINWKYHNLTLQGTLYKTRERVFCLKNITKYGEDWLPDGGFDYNSIDSIKSLEGPMKFILHCNPEFSTSAQEFLKALGYEWKDKKFIINYYKEPVAFRVEGNVIDGWGCYSYFRCRTFEDYPFYHFPTSGNLVPKFEIPKIMVGSHEVKFEKGQIKVGCKTIANCTVKNILERLKNPMKIDGTEFLFAGDTVTYGDVKVTLKQVEEIVSKLQ